MSASKSETVALAVGNILEYNGCNINICRRSLRECYFEYEPFLQKIHGTPLHICGSSAEGLYFMNTKFGMKGDLDLLIVLNTSIAHIDMTRVTRDFSDLHQLLIQQSEGNYGYVLLTLIKEGRMDDLFSEVTTWDGEYQYLTNKIWQHQISKASKYFNMTQDCPGGPSSTGFHHQGPSEAMELIGFTMGLKNGFEVEKNDIVPAIPCSEWPPEANEWLTRKRKFRWPPEDVITKIKKGGSYLVPLGCEGSQTQDLEWKYSFSHTEKHLIWSLSSVQFKCYIVLKLLRYFVFSELHRDIISSYIIKTSVLWTVEETGPNCWTPPMLLDCAKRCVIRITTWVTKDFCPNYIMRECNLLRNRYNEKEKDQVLETLTDLINNLESYVCNLPPVMKELQNNSLETLAQGNDISMQLMQIINPIAPTTMNVMQALNQTCALNIHLKTCYGLLTANNTDLQMIRSHLTKGIQEFSSDLLIEDFYSVGFTAVLTAKVHVLSVLQQLSDPTRQENVKVMESIASLEKTCQPVSGKVFLVNRLYLATVHLSMGYIQGALEAVKVVDEYFKKHPYIVLDHAKFTHQLLYKNAHDQMKLGSQILGLNAIKQREKHATSSDSNVYINDVHFAFVESPLLPKPLQLEVILRAKVDNVTDDLGSSSWKSVISIDPLVFSCFVQFWCHCQLQNNIEQLRAIKSLQERCEDGMTTNKDTAWNLLGYCHQTVGQYRSAFNAYFQALRENPANKASLYYVSILLKKTEKG